jgi:hypothetical protein
MTTDTDTKNTGNFPIDLDILKDLHSGDGPHKKIIKRDGDRDLAFTGWLIGLGKHGTGGSGYECDWTQGTETGIYLTTGGNLVVRIHRWSRWQGVGERNDAVIVRSADALLRYLREDYDGENIGWSAKAALDSIEYAPLRNLGIEEIA